MAIDDPRQLNLMQYILVFITLIAPISLAADVEIEDSFDKNPSNGEVWNLCQAFRYLNSPPSGQSASPDSAYRFGTDGFHGTIKCGCLKRSGCFEIPNEFAPDYIEEAESDEETELVPARLLPDVDLLTFQADTAGQCDDFDPKKVAHNRIVQKNEIRLWQDLQPKANIGYWYSFRFRIDGKIEECGSMRWVGGQFKAGDKDGSPVLAQRFDNGVFHITIEVPRFTDNEDSKQDSENEKKTERFIVAKSDDGNPDSGSEYQPVNKGEATFTCDLNAPSKVSSRCLSEGLVYSGSGSLPSSRGGHWIQMDYYIKLAVACNGLKGAKCDREIEVWAQGEKIFNVNGHFGAPLANGSPLKFKIGVYRDLQVGNAGLTIDQFTLRKDPDKKWCPLRRLSPPQKCP